MHQIVYRVHMTRPDMPHLGMLRIKKKKSLTKQSWSLNTTKIPLIWGQFPESGNTGLHPPTLQFIVAIILDYLLPPDYLDL